MHFSAMIENHLKIFASHNQAYPERIFIFRDGLSEGQYAAAMTYEHNAVLKAAARLQEGYRPKVLICVCAKRHNTRFFGRNGDVDRSGNLPSGLVVDRSVTHPYAFDFFLQAHQGRVGTARPTHYICLLDETGVTPDDLQRLVHNLCYTFARCTKSVSLVPVCYIAGEPIACGDCEDYDNTAPDLVCQKARFIVNDVERATTYAPSESSANKKSATGSTIPGLDVMQVQKLLDKNPAIQDVVGAVQVCRGLFADVAKMWWM